MPKYPTSSAAKSIYIDLREVRKYLKAAVYLMTKADRVIYGTPMLQAHAQCLRSFVIAQEFKDEQYRYLKEFAGYFAEFCMELDLITEEKVIHFTKPENAEKLPALQREIFTYIDRVDVALEKWKSSTRNGYALLRNLWECVSENWKAYCELDLKRCCVVAKDGYHTNQLLAKKYNLSKHYHYDTREKKRAA